MSTRSDSGRQSASLREIERGDELGHVRDGHVHSHLRRRVRVRGDVFRGELRGDGLSPHRRPREEESLLGIRREVGGRGVWLGVRRRFRAVRRRARSRLGSFAHARYARRSPPRSAMFSPWVNSPFTERHRHRADLTDRIPGATSEKGPETRDTTARLGAVHGDVVSLFDHHRCARRRNPRCPRAPTNRSCSPTRRICVLDRRTRASSRGL